MRQTTTEDTLYRLGLVAALVAAIVVLLEKLLPEPFFKLAFRDCPIYALTGLYCPGCGGTRAILALLQGDLLKSIWYHPIVPYGVALYAAFMGSHTLKRFTHGRIKGMKYRDGYLYGAVILVIGNVLVKNLLRLVWGIDIL